MGRASLVPDATVTGCMICLFGDVDSGCETGVWVGISDAYLDDRVRLQASLERTLEAVMHIYKHARPDQVS